MKLYNKDYLLYFKRKHRLIILSVLGNKFVLFCLQPISSATSKSSSKTFTFENKNNNPEKPSYQTAKRPSQQPPKTT